jgi:hypothetical protein
MGLPGESEESMRDTIDWLVSDECTLDIFGFLPLYIRHNEDGRSTSKIDRDPAKFGYVLNQDKPWEGKHMNFTRAIELVREFNNDPRVQKKAKLSAATWIGRIINLEYTIEDIFKMINDPNVNQQNINILLGKKSTLKKELYYEKLMKV